MLRTVPELHRMSVRRPCRAVRSAHVDGRRAGSEGRNTDLPRRPPPTANDPDCENPPLHGANDAEEPPRELDTSKFLLAAHLSRPPRAGCG